MTDARNTPTFVPTIRHRNAELLYAKVAQLVERDLAKVEVAGSNPVFRSTKKAPVNGAFFVKWRLEYACRDGGIGRHAGLKILWATSPCGFDSRSWYYKKSRAFECGFFCWF